VFFSPEQEKGHAGLYFGIFPDQETGIKVGGFSFFFSGRVGYGIEGGGNVMNLSWLSVT
jgi:hypothetical protein